MSSALGCVTVVIPVWGRYVDFLGEAVAGIEAERGRPRVLVVDNASEPPVQAPEHCDVVRSKVRLSTGESRNLALPLVTTEYVLFLDADDLLLPGAVPHLVGGLDRHPDSSALVGRIVEASGAMHRVPRKFCRVLARRPKMFAWANAIWSLTPIQGCAIMRTAAVREAGGYPDASCGEDWVLATSLAFRGSIWFDREPVLVYRWRADSPGRTGLSRHTLLENAARIRHRLRHDPAVLPDRLTIAVLAIAQALAVFVLRPLVKALRRWAPLHARDPVVGSRPVWRLDREEADSVCER